MPLIPKPHFRLAFDNLVLFLPKFMINMRHDDINFEIVNFPFLDGDNPRSTSYGVYISQLIHFARASSYVTSTLTLNC